MSGYVSIKQRTIPERPLWAIGGILGVLVPLVAAPMTVLTMLFPLVVPVLIAALATYTWRIRGRRDAGAVRQWAAIAWVVLVGPLVAGITYAFYPGGELPRGMVGLLTGTAEMVLIFGGSSVLAVAAYEIGHRRLWNGVA